MKGIALGIVRWTVGILFIFSGLIKINDPLGFGYKLQEYFEVFHLSFLGGFATGIGILLCVLEVVLGALLLFQLWSEKVTGGLLAVILFFTLLTFVSAAFKVVTSCGCFGDAVPLTPWQSFLKDLVLLAMIVFLFRNRQELAPLVSGRLQQRAILGSVFIATLSLGAYTYHFLPIIDFLPYKVGADIPGSMKIPEGERPDEYALIYTLRHKETGETKKISDKAYMAEEIWKDDQWEIKGDPDRKLVKKGYDVKIKDLVISDASGTDYTRELVENPYYHLIVVAYRLNDTDEESIGEINALALNAVEQFNVRTVLLTSNAAEEAEAFSKRMKLFMEVFYADAVPLKSMVRSNPGLLLLKNGVVIAKWPHTALPTFEELTQHYLTK